MALPGPGGALRLLLVTVLATLLSGCGGDEPPAVCSLDRSLDGGSTADAGAPEDAPADAGAQLPFAVALAATDGSQAWGVAATHGRVDEPFVLTAASASDRARARVLVAVSPARLGREEAPLSVQGTRDGAIDIAPGESIVLRLSGKGLAQAGTYRANLTVGPRVYAIKIGATDPYRPLGLRVARVERTWQDVPPFGEKAHRLVIAADLALADGADHHVVVKPAATPTSGWEPLPSCGISAHGLGRPGVIAIEMPALGPGQYEGVIEIEGEPLAVTLTLKNHWVYVATVVFLAGLLSIGVRALVRHLAASAKSEDKIAQKEKKVGLSPLTREFLHAQNVFRQARGSITWLGLNDVDNLLAEVEPRDHPELGAIEAKLGERTLPLPIRQDVEEELARALRSSSSADAERIQRRIRQIQAIVEGGAAAWVADLVRHVEDEERRIASDLDRLDQRAHDGAKHLRAAFKVFTMLAADAVLVIEHDPEWFKKVEGHASQLRLMRRTLLRFADWVTAEGGPTREIRTALLCQTEAHDRPAPPEPPLHGLRLRLAPDAPPAHAHRELTFEIVKITGREVTVWSCDKWPVTWHVDGKAVGPAGGPRLTYVFSSRRPRNYTLKAVIGAGLASPTETFPIAPAESPVVSSRARIELLNVVVTVAGVGVAAAAAVALYWAKKPFGSWSDYMTLLTTGIGVDVGLGASTQLVAGVVGFLRQRTAGSVRENG